MESLTLQKIESIQGNLHLVGSKSLTNRALLLAALSDKTITLKNILRSDDSKVMLEALTKLGVELTIHEEDDTVVTIKGCSGYFPYAKHLARQEVSQVTATTEPLELFLGNAGTAMRPLCAALALSYGKYRLVGEERMYERPIGVLVDALRQLGAKITYLKNEGYPPLLIEGCRNFQQHEETKLVSDHNDNKVKTISLTVSGNTSSQFISALLMTAPLLEHNLELKVAGELISKPYVHLTCELLKQFGVTVINHNNAFSCFTIHANEQIIAPSQYLVEGDASGATYFLAAAAIQGHVRVYGIGNNSLQGDTKFVEVLRKMGAIVNIADDYIEVKSNLEQKLNGIEIDMNDMPDAAMTLVPMALFCKGKIVIKNIASWKVKETDRILAMYNEMKKLKCYVEAGDDYILIDAHNEEYQAYKQSKAIPCFDTYNDHRMAMCMSLVALDRTITINDPNCCKKTFPDYFERLASLSNL